MDRIARSFQPGDLAVLEETDTEAPSIVIVRESDERVTFVEHIDGRLSGQIGIARTVRLRPVLRREPAAVPAG
jgi:hypothetical protein